MHVKLHNWRRSATLAAMKMLVCFIDGVGLTDPPAAPWLGARLPALGRLLGETPGAGLLIGRPGLAFRALDATLGVAGLPQSGTGHTTLWTGRNAPALLGRHYPAYPAPSQRPLIAESNLFGAALALGRRPLLATVHRSDYWALVASRQQRATAAALAAQAAGLALPTVDDYLAGRALPWDITTEFMRRWGAFDGLPEVTADEAGRRLARLLAEADLVHYECYLPDFVGHERIAAGPGQVLELIDGLIGGIVAELPAGASLLVVSDHGNLEEPWHKRHTRNPVPLLVVGPAARFAADAADLTHVTPLILAALAAD